MYDFIIVGAGPAGLSAGETLGKNRAKVLVIDEKKEIGKPVLCGETVSALALRNMGAENGAWVRNTLKGYRLEMPNGKYVFIDEEMVLLSRERFEHELYERASATGADFRMGEPVKYIKMNKEGYHVFTAKGRFDSRYIIGADGPTSIVGDFIGAYEKKSFVCASINYVRRDAGDAEDYERIIFNPARYRDGYEYIFPAGDGSYNVGIVTEGKKLASQNRIFLKEHGFHLSYFNRSAIPLNFRMKYRAKDGVMLAGDAAGLVSSVTYGGIYPAFESGKLAGKIGSEALSSDEKEPFKEYDRRLRKEPFFQKNREKDHEMVYSLSEEELNLIGELVNGRTAREIGAFEGLSFLIKHRALHMAFKMLRMKKYASSAKFGV